jgi:hypothetical protein
MGEVTTSALSEIASQPLIASARKMDRSGALGGVQAGFALQSGSLVYGVEGDDTSAHQMAEILSLYAQHQRGGRPAPVPVTFVHLSPGPDAAGYGFRSTEMAAVACATGGDYIFVPQPQQLDVLADPETDAIRRFAHRFTGAWQLTTEGDLTGLEPGGHLLSARLRATIGDVSQSTDVEDAYLSRE